MRWTALYLAALLLAASCAVGPGSQSTPSSEASTEREKELTAEIHEQIRAQAPLINDPFVLEFLYEIGGEIVEVTEPQPFIYRFFIIDDDELNAFTIGGGYVYLNREVIAQAGDINELAGVLAHEIAHVRERHIARKAEGGTALTLATLAAMAAVAAGADPGVLLLTQGINQALQIQHTRRHEEEADRSGLSYMVKAGYEPLGMTRFFQRILAAYPNRGDGIPSYLFTHPALEQRVRSARVELKRIGAPPNLRRSDARLAKIQERLSQVGSRLAGGTGLLARAEFDRERTNALLAQAREARAAGDLTRADGLLDQAQKREPRDPRVLLLRAELAEQREDLAAARDYLTAAWELDPAVPLVQYRLGSVYRRLGNRSQAVFFLEQAAAQYRRGSSLRRKAELEIQRLEFPVLVESGFDRGKPDDPPPVYRVGERVQWRGEIGKRYRKRPPELEAQWIAPSGDVQDRDELRVGENGKLVARMQVTTDVPKGLWKIRVRAEGDVVGQREFRIDP